MCLSLHEQDGDDNIVLGTFCSGSALKTTDNTDNHSDNSPDIRIAT